MKKLHTYLMLLLLSTGFVHAQDSLVHSADSQKASMDTALTIISDTVVDQEPQSDEPVSAEQTVKEVSDNLENALGTAFDLLSLGKILTILLIILITYLLVRGLGFIFQYLADRFKRNKFLILRIQPIINVLLWVVAIYSSISTIFEENTDVLFALTGSSALALGFAAQDLLKNIFGGLMIIFDRPFQKGDRIRVGEYYGEVDKIGIRVTRIKTLDDNLVTIPNAKIISDSVSDANFGENDCMVVVHLWIPTTADFEVVKKIAYEAAITSRYLNLDKEVSVLFFEEFHERPITHVTIKAYVFDARYEKAFESDVTEAAKKALGFANIWQAPTTGQASQPI